MAKLLSKLKGFFSLKTLAGVDKAGNRYFTRVEDVDGIMKEKRWVIFKGEEDPTAIPVEWICWLNGQRKKAPTPQEMVQLEAMRERVKQNVLLLKKQEEEKKASGAYPHQRKNIGKDGSPDLRSFIQQFPDASFGHKNGDEGSTANDDTKTEDRSTEPTGSGQSFKPGMWQPPT
ncbi:uncharacterized protein A4U43_C08F25280 [Asparagus officinalis]|uniref:mimitin, mitochondrial isoform X2 n=1 Tax=Asparagus officinalis TaxID=4686 RepID=UPI00098E643C|nr:mimitin, mitochondrial isoform X2 [Asparagus officinalis]ONK61022.1 uncharacterized protein A4U43_C08F25280 [Asparagus officinalis]